MSNLRKTILICVLGIVTLLAGCGAETTAAGGGFAGGLTFSETLKSVQADLERREQALIARYNELVEAGAKADTLEELKQEIAETVRLRQGAETVESVATTDWTDPKAAGGAIGLIATLLYGWTKRKQLLNTVDGLRTFRADSDEPTKHKLDAILLEKRAAT